MSGLANTAKGYFPLDIAGVTNAGVEEWFASYSEPVPPSFFCEIRERFFRCFSENMPDASAKPDLYHAWLINYKIALSLSNYYFKHSILDAVRKKGYPGLLSVTKMDFDSADQKYREVILGNTRIQRRPFPRNLIDKYRFLRQNKFDLRSLCSGFNGRHKNYIIGDRDRAEIRFFLDEKGIEPCSINPSLFIRNGGKKLNNVQEAETKALVDSFFARIFDSMPESKEVFGESVKRIILDIVTDKYRHYLSFVETISKYNISGRDLIVCPCGNTLFRIFACAWRRNGGTVTGFSHGNVYSYIYTPGDINNGSQLILDRYITCSKGETKLLEESRKDFRNGLESKAVMETCKASFYKTVFDSIRNGPEVQSVKKVMVVGFPYSFDMYNSLPYLHLETFIIRTLKAAGFEVLYKAHPDSLSDATGFFKGMVDSIITDSFETVYNMADCIVFPIHYSTTFGFALMTNRPIVIMESPLLTGWHPDVARLIGKRCCSVRLSLDEKYLFSFDKGEFISSIHDSVNRNDLCMVETFAF